MTLQIHERPPVALTSFPWEVFDEISYHLDARDLMALSRACKGVNALAERALYAEVKVRDKTAFSSLSRVLSSKPHLSTAVRTFRIGRYAPWWSLDLADTFSCLREFFFRSNDLARGDAVHVVRKLTAGGWIQPSLRRCSIHLSYSVAKKVPRDDLHAMLCVVLSVPWLEAVAVTCIQDQPDIYDVSEFWREPSGFEDLLVAPSRRLPDLYGNKCTDLRELRLHWNGLPLSWVSALLELPRRLEALHLQVNGHRLSYHPRDDIPLNSALRPVVDTLRKLVIYPEKHESRDRDPDIWDDGFRIEWGPGGLREFEKLDFVGIPAHSWTGPRFHSPPQEHRLLPGYLPEFLTTVQVIGAQLVRNVPDDWNAFIRTGQGGMETAPAKYYLGDVYNMEPILEDTPLLRYIQVTVGQWVDVDKLRQDMPAVRLAKSFKPLVDLGVKVLVQITEGDILELDTYV